MPRASKIKAKDPDAPVAYDQNPITRRKVQDMRHARDLHELIPPDAIPNYEDDFYDILNRITSGYWPQANIGLGWYQLITELNKNLRQITDNYSITALARENGALRFTIRVPINEENLLPELMGFIRMAVARSRCICEICGEVGDEAIVNHDLRVLCSQHIPLDTHKYG
jgi:hypothetical protein